MQFSTLLAHLCLKNAKLRRSGLFSRQEGSSGFPWIAPCEPHPVFYSSGSSWSMENEQFGFIPGGEGGRSCSPGQDTECEILPWGPTETPTCSFPRLQGGINAHPTGSRGIQSQNEELKWRTNPNPASWVLCWMANTSQMLLDNFTAPFKQAQTGQLSFWSHLNFPKAISWRD